MKMTQKRYEKYQNEIEEKRKLLEEARQAASTARELGDFSENTELETANQNVRNLIIEIQTLEDRLKDVEIIEQNNSEYIDIGDTVSVTQLNDKGEAITEPRTFIVEEIGDTVIAGVLSVRSPLGKIIYRNSSGMYKVPLRGGIYYRVEKDCV